MYNIKGYKIKDDMLCNEIIFNCLMILFEIKANCEEFIKKEM